MFIYNKVTYLNDVASYLNISIENAISLYQKINIKNCKVLIRCKCLWCGKETDKVPSVYMKKRKIFCSQECYWNNKRADETISGENSRYFNRIDVKCSYCGKNIKVTPFNYNIKNKYGESHNFCSQQCYWNFRSEYYIGSKSTMANYEFTEEQREHRRKIMIQNARKAKRLDSKIQLKVNSILDSLGIKYEREYIVGHFAIDNYLPVQKLFIEVMGDFWHASPLKYNENRYGIINSQRRTLSHDKQKLTYLKNHYDTTPLYLWENDIDKNPYKCELLIDMFIKNNGILEDYNSFNYCVQDNKLIFKKINIPYQYRQIDEYRHLFVAS